MMNEAEMGPGATLVKHLAAIKQQDELDVEFSDHIVTLAVANCNAVTSSGAVALPPPAQLPASSRIVSLRFGHVSDLTLLSRLGTYFPKLERLQCWAVTAAELVREGPTSAEIAAHGGGMPSSNKHSSSSGDGGSGSSGYSSFRLSSSSSSSSSSSGTTTSSGTKHCPLQSSCTAVVQTLCQQPGKAWLQRFPALQTLTLWMDPRDLPCRGGVHFLHLELPRLM
ncbi:MAG: hypothetical protein WDW38_009240 [Sanguina aurantia]